MQNEPCRAKVAQIRAAACELFLANGFVRTSMDQVAAKANVSKTTLYAHFASKETLFLSVLEDQKQRLGLGIPKELPVEAVNVRDYLRKVALSLLEALTHPLVRSLFRLVIAEGAHAPTLGKVMWEEGPALGHRRMAQLLVHFAAQGQLRLDDPDIAVDRFLGLVRSNIMLRCVMDVNFTPDKAAIAQHVEQCLDFFLSAYGA